MILEEIKKRQHRLVRTQPIDENHKRLSRDVIAEFEPMIDGKTVLDIGCGQGVAKVLWESLGYEWAGVTMSKEDCRVLSANGWRYYKADMHDVRLCSYDILYARHVLEHSPYPVIALKAWMQVAPVMIVVVPAPTEQAYKHIGHLSLFPKEAWERYFQFLEIEVVVSRYQPYNNPPQFPQGGGEFRFLLKNG